MSKEKFEYVWYVCYGSNLLEERFTCYISGGRPAGSFRTYTGCTDKTLPAASKSVEIKAELYFAKRSKTWSAGGVAFIKPDESSHTLGKMYLISAEQFTELVKQEIRFAGEFKPDLALAVKNGHLITKPETWYGKILYLGRNQELPMFSFTNIDFLEKEINAPDKYYLKNIILGLKETYDLSEKQILEYLSCKRGIQGNISEKDLITIIKK